MRKSVDQLRREYEQKGLEIYHPPDVGIQLRDFSKDVEIGKRFGKLVVLGWQFRVPPYVWKVVCQCDCGEVSVHRVLDIAKKDGGSKSCGCGLVRARTASRYVHGESGTRLYWVWRTMKARCLNPGDKAFPQYGGRGIRPCKDWIESYPLFAAWSRRSGYRQDRVLTRKDLQGSFSPKNCIWVNRLYIRSRVSNNKTLTLNGKSKTMAQWSRHTGIKVRTLASRVRLGWPDERVLTEPVGKAGRGAKKS